MINVAIYPRKSKANDNSQSMDQQISDCRTYINSKYDDANIVVYDGDYALTGHSTAKRKDFQRMMNDIRAKKIQLVVIMRYDRIARNMRDFCNLYHDMEENGCNLVSVSQQIDTSTPYGKNFMYQMASMAELEWAITSERYKDTAKYKRDNGYAYTGRVAYGYKIEKQADGHKRVIKDESKRITEIFDYYRKCRTKSKTVQYVIDNIDSKFTYDIFRDMLECDMYFGRVPGNDHFCEPYYTEEEFNTIRNIKNIKISPTKRHYIFSKLVECPYCHNTMQSAYGGKDKALQYYRCGYISHVKKHNELLVSELKLEEQLLERLDAILDDSMKSTVILSSKEKESLGSALERVRNSIDRLNYMFEKGRVSFYDYDTKYKDLETELNDIKTKMNGKDLQKTKEIISGNWKELYSKLDAEHKKIFWNSIVSRIYVDAEKRLISVLFCDSVV